MQKMKNSVNQFTIFPFALLRTPTLPWSSALLSEELDLLETYKDSTIVEEALYVASPQLHDYWKNAVIKKEQDLGKLKISLRKYLLRMSYRCTPFGLFAGVSVVRFGNSSSVRLNEIEASYRICRPDLRFLMELTKQAQEGNSIVESTEYKPNPTIRKVNRDLRYIADAGKLGFELASVELSEQLASILRLAEHESSPAAFAAHIEENGITIGESLEFVNEVILAQVLVGPTIPNLIRKDYLADLMRCYTRLPIYHNYLHKLNSAINNINTMPIGAGLEAYQELYKIGICNELGINNFSYTDYYRKTLGATLSKNITNEAIRILGFLSHIPNTTKDVLLDKFKRLFIERYEEREIPILEALDPEMGLGYPVSGQDTDDGNALLAGLPFRETALENQAGINSKWQDFLLSKYTEALMHNEEVITINVDECAPYLEKEPASLPFSMFSFVSVAAASEAAIDQGNFTLIHNLTSGPSALNPLARFAHLSEDLTDNLRSIADEEQKCYPEAILADVVYPGKGQAVNLMVRPQLYNYQLPLSGGTDVSEARSLSLQDISISVQNSRLVLRSSKYDREIIPRLSSAHAYAQDLHPIYTLLGDLQHQDYQYSLRWRWGNLDTAPYLPRVVVGQTILAKARWRLDEYQAKQVSKLEGSTGEEYLRALRVKLKIPRFIAVLNGEDEIPFDLDAPASLILLKSIIRKSKRIILQEIVSTGDWLCDQKGSYLNELILPIKNDFFRAPVSSRAKYVPASVTRSFLPGSEWIYLKVYCETRSVDNFLLQVFALIAERGISNGSWLKWFLVRYKDKRPHVRIRVLSGPGQQHQALQELLDAVGRAEQDGLISSVRVDSYSRELERYGWNNIEASEDLFFFQSELVLSIILAEAKVGDLNQGYDPVNYRWLSAICFIDEFLSELHFSIDQKEKLLYSLQFAFKEEFNFNDSSAKRHLGAVYRREKSKISSMLDKEDIAEFSIYRELISNAIARNSSLIHTIKANLTVESIDSTIMSYIHMFVNRLIPSQQRRYELIIYDLLHQHYRMKQALDRKLS
jgi:thiopeptide-type bacteriocin biosynthesis protein